MLVAAKSGSVTERTDGSGELDAVSGERRSSSQLVDRIPADALNEFSASESNVCHPAVADGHVGHILLDKPEMTSSLLLRDQF